MTYFDDVGEFHRKFDLPSEADPQPPAPLTPDVLSYRIAFMLEELAEFCESQGVKTIAGQLRSVMDLVRDMKVEASTAGLADGGDALVDLVYVALGTAHLMRLPFNEMWDEVQRANLAKERAIRGGDTRSKRGHDLDVVKPAGWRGPEHWPILFARATGPWDQVTRIATATHEELDRIAQIRSDLCYCAGRKGHERATPGCLWHRKHL